MFGWMIMWLFIGEISAIAAADMVFDFLSILALGVEAGNDEEAGVMGVKDEL
jgi:agmatinase